MRVQPDLPSNPLLATVMSRSGLAWWAWSAAKSPAQVPARMEALAALGGLDRAALHSQLAAAVQVVVHVSRGPCGRRVSEIAILRQDRGGVVCVAPVWHAERGLQPGVEALQRIIAERSGR